MKTHYLELFYYVAKHGGISNAVQNMPYGIQQPAISAQIIQLEDDLGVQLFQRRPFRLTAAGEELYAFVKPFFGGLEVMRLKLQGEATYRLRIGASQLVLGEHLPPVLSEVRKKFPRLKLLLRDAHAPELISLLERDELDVAITLMEGKPAAGLIGEELIKVPPVLLVPAAEKIRSAEELWKMDRIPHRLIALQPNEVMCREFQKCLARRKVDWVPTIEAASLALVERYVEEGYGFGLSVIGPGRKLGPKLRALELPDVPAMTIGVLWRGKPNLLMRTFLDELQRYVAKWK